MTRQKKLALDACRLLLRVEAASLAKFGEGEDFSSVLDEAIALAKVALQVGNKKTHIPPYSAVEVEQ